jgi:hypothetical protein
VARREMRNLVPRVGGVGTCPAQQGGARQPSTTAHRYPGVTPRTLSTRDVALPSRDILRTNQEFVCEEPVVLQMK